MYFVIHKIPGFVVEVVAVAWEAAAAVAVGSPQQF